MLSVIRLTLLWFLGGASADELIGRGSCTLL